MAYKLEVRVDGDCRRPSACDAGSGKYGRMRQSDRDRMRKVANLALRILCRVLVPVRNRAERKHQHSDADQNGEQALCCFTRHTCPTHPKHGT